MWAEKDGWGNNNSDSGIAETTTEGGMQILVGAAGVCLAPVVMWSSATLYQTGCGLPPGPGGILGAIEGVSYLTVVGIAGWSVVTKVKTGDGLPPGPSGLLGGAEGLSYLAILVGIGSLIHQVSARGFIPSALPSPECFG